MQVTKRTLNWLPRASAYDEAVAAREKRRANNETFLAETSATATALIGGTATTTSEQVDLAIQVAVDRIENGTTKKV